MYGLYLQACVTHHHGPYYVYVIMCLSVPLVRELREIQGAMFILHSPI